MINIPIVDDRFDLRIAGEWTKRNGYTDRHDLGHARRWPRSVVRARDARLETDVRICRPYFVWEHFSEDDDRLRSGKQLCETAPPVTSVEWRAGTAGGR